MVRSYRILVMLVLVALVVAGIECIDKLKDWLGHANLNTTQIYVHMGEENTHRLMEQTSL